MLLVTHAKIGMDQDALVSCQGRIKVTFNLGLGYSQGLAGGTLCLEH